MTDLSPVPLSKAVLAEQWFSLLQSVLSALQVAFRASGLTKESLAKRVGKDPAFVNRCLRGVQNMTLRTMHELARGMNCRLRIVLEPLDQIVPTNHRPKGNTGAPTLTSSIAPSEVNVLRSNVALSTTMVVRRRELVDG